MTRSRTYIHILVATAATLVLSACVVRPNQPASSPYGTVSESNVTQAPHYYRGTTSNAAPMNNDATITANVIQAISRMSGATNLQVSTLNGVVTLTGVADNQLTAQNDVEAARQVPGVLRVDYDIEVLRQ
ncbi:MAG: BON domain-containing protein [Burkholderiaceae bacterium]|nr:BON domain-containing protein [Burkholderiaceae bacterium]